MARLAIVATIKTAAEQRSEYLKHLQAHAERCRTTEPGTLRFDVLVPHKEADTIMLFELYESLEAFQAHWNGASMKQVRADTAGIQSTMSGVRCDLVE
jgi:quinol monooxygenase YgiN